MWGIIGGSGFESFTGVEKLAAVDGDTPFGKASSGLRKIKLGGVESIFLPRHGQNHELTPSEVNYRANIFAMKRAGVTRLIALSAVGSLRQELAPGDLVIPNQYMDRTKSLRPASFSGSGFVAHVSLAHPIWKTGAEAVQKLGMDFNVHPGKTYIVVEGPYFSTCAESLLYRQWGADIIGMTGFPEFALAREAGICYLPLSFVTDYDCWNDQVEHVTVQMVMETMRQNNQKAFRLLQKLLPLSLTEDAACREGGLRQGLMTPKTAIDPKTLEWLEILLR